MARINIMAHRHSAFFSPLLMTIAGGYLKQQGLDSSYKVATHKHPIPESIHNGSCDVAQSMVATSFAAFECGEVSRCLHFAQINQHDGFFLVSREIDNDFHWRDLEGKKILVDPCFQAIATLKFALYKQGVDVERVEFAIIHDLNLIERMFRDGLGDFIQAQGPVAQRLALGGDGYVVAALAHAYEPISYSSLCASRQWLDTDVAKVFSHAYHESLQFVNAAPAREIAVRLIRAGFFPETDMDALVSAVSAYQSIGCWNHTGSISRSSYNHLLEVYAYNGLISHRYAYDAVVAVTAV